MIKDCLLKLLILSVLYTCTGCDAVRRIPDPDATDIVIEVAIFEGGYGINWHESVARRYEAAFPEKNIRINLWGDPRVEEIVKPRILRGDPPDLLLVHNLPIWILIASGKLQPFNSALQYPPPGSDAPWSDLFTPGTLANFSSEGVVYGIPSAFGAWGVWYDARMFREHGWNPPTTWDEFLVLCENIRDSGIAPLAYQGKYPVYAWFTFVSLIQRCGGLEAINRINLPDPGAFSHPDVVQAARLLQDLARDHFQRGALAMTHTESQLQFVNSNTAMIFCGLWLYNEMKESVPLDFEMRCFNMPEVIGGKGNPSLFNGQGTEFLFVPVDAKHPQAAFDFARYMVSPDQAPGMGTQIGVISPLIDATPPDAVPPPLQSALKMIEQAPGIFNIRLNDLLLEWNAQVMLPSMARLLRGELSPEAFCAALDQGVATALGNPDIIIPPYKAIDPALFGEGTVEDHS